MGKTYQSITLKAPADKVWSTIRNFHDLSWAPNVVTKVKTVGKLKGDQVGAKRVLNDAFHETLLELSDVSRSIKYSIDDGPSPVSKNDVSNYVGSVQVRPITESRGGTFVEWSSSWDGNDAACEDFCHPIYVALLSDMKKSLG